MFWVRFGWDTTYSSDIDGCRVVSKNQILHTEVCMTIWGVEILASYNPEENDIFDISSLDIIMSWNRGSPAEADIKTRFMIPYKEKHYFKIMELFFWL